MFDNTPDGGLRQLFVFGQQVLLEIIIEVVEDDLEVLLLSFVLDFDEPVSIIWLRHDIWMILECFEHRNLPEGGGRYTFLIAFEFDLLDGDNFAVGIDPFEDPAERPLANLFKISVFLKFFHLNYFYNTPNSMIRT